MLSPESWEKLYHLVTGAITLWAVFWSARSFYRHRLKLKATATQDMFRLPNDMANGIRAIQDKVRRLQAEVERKDEPLAYVNALLDDLNKGYEFDLFAIREIWTVKIENRSRLEIKDIKLAFNASGLFITDRPDQTRDSKAFDRYISIGTMQYGDTETLTIWTKGTYSSDRENIRLTFPTGFVKVDTGKLYFGGPKRLAGMYEAAGFVGVFIIACVIINFIAQLTSMATGYYIKTHPASTQPTTLPVVTPH